MSYSFRKNIVELYRGGFFSIPFKLFLFNSFIVLSAYFSAGYIPGEIDAPQVWFQRSGAVVTLVTIWIEVKLVNKISQREIFNEIVGLKVTLSHFIPNFDVTLLGEKEARKANSDDIEKIRKQTKNRAKFFNGVIFFNLALGTLIWAYGDIFYLSFS